MWIFSLVYSLCALLLALYGLNSLLLTVLYLVAPARRLAPQARVPTELELRHARACRRDTEGRMDDWPLGHGATADL